MNVLDVMKYGHLTLLEKLGGLPESAWEVKGVVGSWSVKDLVAHLASFEQVLVELLGSFLDPSQPTPTLELFHSRPDFNDTQVAARREMAPSDVLSEYERWHTRALELAARLPPDVFRQHGTLPWYGMDYDLEDFIIYTYYGHKREHGAQIALFKKRYTQEKTG